MPEKILMIAPTSFFADYGGHIRILEEARALQKRGHQLTIATYHNGDDLPGLDIRRSWDVPWIKRALVGSSRHKLYLDVALSYCALQTALRVRPNLIHAHMHEGALMGSAIKRILKVPMVFDFQGSLTSEMVDHGFLNADGRLYRPLRAFERLINLQADALITSTANAAELLQRDFGFPAARLHVVNDRVDTDRHQPFDGSPEWRAERERLRAELGIPPGRRIVAYLGLLASYQGVNLLMESARLLLQQLPDVHFLIMGYPDVPSYQRLAESLGIAENVTLPGRILYKDTHAYLSLGDVAVAPKMSATEGSGKIPLYMSMALPTITFDTPVSREYLADTGIYAQFGSAEDLASKLRIALEQPAWAAALGRAARARALRELSWDQAARQIEAIYADVLGRQAVAEERRAPNERRAIARRSGDETEEAVERGA
ncbi:MAG TPA: glycosyltransferase family 4 protein [Roseiflexaceae bacterium]|nr:glycosyltransferase family 4 protein [Roseiflexaceae bacterium]